MSEVEAQLRKQPNWNESDHPELLKDALDKARRLKRMEQFFDAEQILLDELPIIPLYYYVSKSMVRPYLKGWYHNIQDVHPFKGMRIDKKEKRKFLEAEGL